MASRYEINVAKRNPKYTGPLCGQPPTYHYIKITLPMAAPSDDAQRILRDTRERYPDHLFELTMIYWQEYGHEIPLD